MRSTSAVARCRPERDSYLPSRRPTCVRCLSDDRHPGGRSYPGTTRRQASDPNLVARSQKPLAKWLPGGLWAHPEGIHPVHLGNVGSAESSEVGHALSEQSRRASLGPHSRSSEGLRGVAVRGRAHRHPPGDRRQEPWPSGHDLSLRWRQRDGGCGGHVQGRLRRLFSRRR